MLDKELIMKMYRLMVLSRVTEERMVEYHKQSPLPELPLSGIGLEAIGVGSVLALRPDDQILPSLRTRAAYLAKGVPSRVMMAGAFAKATTLRIIMETQNWGSSSARPLWRDMSLLPWACPLRQNCSIRITWRCATSATAAPTAATSTSQ